MPRSQSWYVTCSKPWSLNLSYQEFPMLKRTVLAKSLQLAFSGSIVVWSAASLAQTAAPADQPAQPEQPAKAAQPSQLQRVEVTGSAIKRIDSETAVPVTIIKFDDLKKQGITTVEQALVSISGNQTSTGTSQAVGAATGGASFADLRGLGSNKTLVLLNGRRIANNTIDGSSTDLNAIPFAAIERIEVLRDGASALYGTDAIGGVINFITRRDLTGGTIALGADSPQHAGGKAYSASIVAGFGNLSNDGFNVLGALDFQKQRPISASQREFGSTGYIPDRGIFRSSGSPDPANYSQGGPSDNPAGPGCTQNPFIFHQTGNSCRYDFTKWVDLVPDTQRNSGFLKGTLKLGQDHQLNLEYFVTSVLSKTTIAPVPFAALTVDPGTPFFPGNGITPAPTAFTIDPTQPIGVRWRDVPNGPRKEQDRNLQQRLVAGLEGAVAGWDYNTALSFSQNKNTHNVTGGYADGTIITPGVQTGVINPFGAQTAAGQALLDSALVTGKLYSGRSETAAVDARASRELGDWLSAGSPVALAVGAEYRKERIRFTANQDVATRLAASTGIDPALDQRGSRSVSALYTELNVPIVKGLEVTGALRYDRYSDFGNSTNPKVSFRWQPIQQVLVRGAYSTGFRAPSLFELNNPNTYTNTANAYNDPVRCPGGVVQPGFAEADVCNTQFIVLGGGNKGLQPEKSKTATLGLVIEPMTDLTLGIDLWAVRLKNQINPLAEELIFADPVKNAALFNRGADGSLSIDGTQCPGVNCGYISDQTSNLGGINTDGVDLSAAYRLRAGDLGTFNFVFAGTYVHKYEYQQEVGGEFLKNVGVYSGSGPIFRWQQTLNVSWSLGEWGLGVVNHFKTGYVDQNDVNQVDPEFFGKVSTYSLWDVWGSWQPTKAIAVTVGVRNVFDKSPPFSNQGATFQTGYDPRFTDATGRAYYLRASYTF
jgi:iron complex outermembrane recepter protein